MLQVQQHQVHPNLGHVQMYGQGQGQQVYGQPYPQQQQQLQQWLLHNSSYSSSSSYGMMAAAAAAATVMAVDPVSLVN